MANILTDMVNNIGSWLGQMIAPYINDAIGRDYSVLGSALHSRVLQAKSVIQSTACQILGKWCPKS